MKIDESCIDHNAVRLIKSALETYLIYADDKEERQEAINIFYGRVAGILEFADALKGVLKT